MNEINRRDVIKWITLGSGAGLAGGGMWLVGNQMGRSANPVPWPAVSATTPQRPTTTDAVDDSIATRRTIDTPTNDSAPQPPPSGGDRLLVVIEFGGGSDGMSLAPPVGRGQYYDLRKATAIAADKAIRIDDEIGLHPNLVKLSKRPLALVQGVGVAKPDGSHFEMLQRWHNGDPDGTRNLDTGIWGRIADQIGDPAAPAVAMSIGAGSHPSLLAAKVGTLALTGPDQAYYLAGKDEGDQVRNAFRRGMAGFSQGGGAAALGLIRSVTGQAIDFSEQLLSLAPVDENQDGTPDSGVAYPGTSLGQSLMLTARLLGAGFGTRIVHIPMNEDFDTHENHNDRFNGLMTNFDDAVDAFLTDLAGRGLADRVVVATTSEFGRRAKDNGSGGLDHGTANNHLVLGAVNSGRFGEYPSLTELDDDNLVATVGMEQYYATLADGWLGADAGAALDGAAPLDGLFA